MNDILGQMPKVELHAHLNGCIRESTLLELAKERNVTLSPLLHELQYQSTSTSSSQEKDVKKVNLKHRSLQDCFEIFTEISKCVTDLNALKRITQESLHDFSKQNVAYLELRSTPKVLYHDITHQTKASKKDYIDTILKAFEEFELQQQVPKGDIEKQTLTSSSSSSSSSSRYKMIPRFIVSINRAETIADSLENANLAIAYKQQNNKYVVGLDLSGNPMKVSSKFESAQCIMYHVQNVTTHYSHFFFFFQIE